MSNAPGEIVCRECFAVVPPFEISDFTSGSSILAAVDNICETCQSAEAYKKSRVQIEAKLRASGIPDRFLNLSPANMSYFHSNNIPAEGWVYPDGKEKIYAWASKWNPGIGSVWIHGEPSSGKTTLAVFMAVVALEIPLEFEVVEAPTIGPNTLKKSGGHSAAFATEREICDEIRQFMKFRRYNDEDAFERYTVPSVLIIDELGFATPRSALSTKGDKEQDENRNIISRIISKRYDSRLPIIFTSYMTPDRSFDHYGRGVAQKITAMADRRVINMSKKS